MFYSNLQQKFKIGISTLNFFPIHLHCLIKEK